VKELILWLASTKTSNRKDLFGDVVPHKSCSLCKRILPLHKEFFNIDKSTSSGYSCQCKQCRKSKSMEEDVELWFSRRKSLAVHGSTTSSRQKRGINWQLTKIPPLPQYCPVFGEPLIYARICDSPWGASIDRIDSSMPYTDENVQVISLRANKLKSDATLEELVSLGKWAEKMLELK
jgi:hypothetical protein